LEVGDDVLVGVLHETTAVRRNGRVEGAVGADRVEHGQSLGAGRLHVVGTERGRDVHDARAVVGAHERGGDDALAGVVDGQVVERPRITTADEVATGETPDHLGVVGGARGRHDQ